jgi:hypothetical protein
MAKFVENPNRPGFVRTTPIKRIAAPEPENPRIAQLVMENELLQARVKSLEQAIENQDRLLDIVQCSISAPQPPAKPLTNWQFEVERDNFGLIKTVIAAGGQ